MKRLRLACLLVLLPMGAAAQGLSVSRLPANTSAYVLWRGTASVEPVRRTNSLLRLWDDPDFAPVRQTLAQQFLAGMKEKGEARSQAQPLVEEILSLLKNPLLLGFTSKLDLATLSSQGVKTSAELSVFLLYDTTGKLALHRKLIERTRTEATEKPAITSYEFAGTTVEKVAYPKLTTYQAYAGNYFLLSNRKEVIEDIIQRTQGAEAPADPIEQNTDFQAWRSFAAEGGLLEFFARVPDLSKAEFPGTKDVDVRALLAALHTERLHALAGSLSLVGERTRLRVALLGDTSAGSLFDLAGESRPSFPTLAVTPAGASYNALNIDLATFYQTLRGALKASLPVEKSSFIELMEGGVGTQTGMSMPELLGLAAGELAWIRTEPSADGAASPDLFALVIRGPNDVVRLLRLLSGPSISFEERQGDTTYLTFARTYTDSKTGAERKHFYHAAVAPHMLLFSPRKTVVSQAAARLASTGAAPPAGTLGADAQFLQARADLPQRLTSLSYSDLARFPWEDSVEGFLQGIQKSRTQQSASANLPAVDKKALAAVLARHLHTYAGGTWKDRNGSFFEGSIK